MKSMLAAEKILHQQLSSHRSFEMHYLGFPLSTRNLSQQCFLSLVHIFLDSSDIKMKTNSPSTGTLRTVWWRNAVQQAMNKGSTEHSTIPSLTILANACSKKAFHLDVNEVKSFFRAWERDLSYSQAPSYEYLEDFTEDSYSSLLRILLGLLNADYLQSTEAQRAVSHIGKSLGLVECIRKSKQMIDEGVAQTYLPADLCAKFGVSEDMIYSKANPTAVSDVVFEIADYAKAHLMEARNYRNTIPKGSEKAFMASTICDNYLDRLEKCNFDLSSPLLDEKNRLSFATTFFWNYFLRRW